LNQDFQQKILATLYYKDIADLIRIQYKDEEDAWAAFYFVGATFNWPTSDSYANIISEAVLEINDSVFKEYIILQITTTMPTAADKLGLDLVFTVINKTLESDNEDLVMQSFYVLYNIIRIKKGNLNYDFSILFNKLDSDNLNIVKESIRLISYFASFPTNAYQFLLEQGIIEKTVDEIQKSISITVKIEYVRLLCTVLPKLNNSVISQLLNLDVVQVMCDLIEDLDDDEVKNDIVIGLNAIFGIDDKEFTNNVYDMMAENGAWDTICKFTVESGELANNSLIFINTYYHEIEIPDDL
jgi:hypothetical protein